MDSLKNIISQKPLKGDHRNKHEFQAYGNRLAKELGDAKHTPLYIKYAKTESRTHLEIAREFALGYENETNKGKLFMWKLKQLKQKKLEDKIIINPGPLKDPERNFCLLDRDGKISLKTLQNEEWYNDIKTLQKLFKQLLCNSLDKFNYANRARFRNIKTL